MAVPATRYQPSRKAYTARPREWEYPPGCLVKRLNSQGCLYWRARCYFVCEALAGQRVAVEPVDQKLLVRYRRVGSSGKRCWRHSERSAGTAGAPRPA